MISRDEAFKSKLVVGVTELTHLRRIPVCQTVGLLCCADRPARWLSESLLEQPCVEGCLVVLFRGIFKNDIEIWVLLGLPRVLWVRPLGCLGSLVDCFHAGGLVLVLLLSVGGTEVHSPELCPELSQYPLVGDPHVVIVLVDAWLKRTDQTHTVI